jgi:hypothetical protein
LGAADTRHVRDLNSFAAEAFRGPIAYEARGLERLYHWTGRVRSPWDGMLVAGVAAGLYAGALLGAWIVIQWSASPLSLIVGLPILGFSGALAAHLVPH